MRHQPGNVEQVVVPERTKKCAGCERDLPLNMFNGPRGRTCLRCQQASKARNSIRGQSKFVSGGLPTLGRHHR